MFKRKY